MSLIDTIFGRPLASGEAGEQRIGTAGGVPTFGLDALSSAAYGPEAALTVLLPLGAAVSGSGDQMLQPLAIAIIAGSLVQLPLVLLAMPVLVGLLVHKRERVPAMKVMKPAVPRARPGAAE